MSGPFTATVVADVADSEETHPTLEAAKSAAQAWLDGYRQGLGMTPHALTWQDQPGLSTAYDDEADAEAYVSYEPSLSTERTQA